MYLSEMIVNLLEIKDRYGDQELLIIISDNEMSNIQEFQTVIGPNETEFIAILPEL